MRLTLDQMNWIRLIWQIVFRRASNKSIWHKQCFIYFIFWLYLHMYGGIVLFNLFHNNFLFKVLRFVCIFFVVLCLVNITHIDVKDFHTNHKTSLQEFYTHFMPPTNRKFKWVLLFEIHCSTLSLVMAEYLSISRMLPINKWSSNSSHVSILLQYIIDIQVNICLKTIRMLSIK